MRNLPLILDHVGVPPLKCQGIKTKLVRFIFQNIQWKASAGGRWIEPFLGSGVVALNLMPKSALLLDTNKHIIRFYNSLQNGDFEIDKTRNFLFQEGKRLAEVGADYYYEVRERFNAEGSSLDFLFLNRCCFNGVMRFNSKGKFNVPFGHKPERFSKAYISKIVNQLSWAMKQIRGNDWEFRVGQWEEAFSEAKQRDFVYIDPPYVGRHTDYYNSWDESEAIKLAAITQQLSSGYALSMWYQNKYRKNHHIEQYWSNAEMRLCNHFYHVGSKESLRNAIEEALLIKPGFAAPVSNQKINYHETVRDLQLTFVMEKQRSYTNG